MAAGVVLDAPNSVTSYLARILVEAAFAFGGVDSIRFNGTKLWIVGEA